MKKNTVRKVFSLVLSLILMSSFFAGTPANAKINNEEKVYVKGENAYITIHRPPKDFDAVNATDAELENYGYPVRPKDADKLNEWKQIVAGKWTAPEVVSLKDKKTSLKKETNISSSRDKYGTTATSRDNWAGYVKSATSWGAMGSWEVPSVSEPSGRNGYSCQWVGVGGFNSDKLVQMGSAAEALTSGTFYYIWYELLGTDYMPDTMQEIYSMPCFPGDKITSFVKCSINSGGGCQVDFYLSNNTRNAVTSFSKVIYNYSNLCTSTEWISERTKVGSSLYDYPRTSCYSGIFIPFTGTKYQTSPDSPWTGLSDASNVYQIYMYNDSGSTCLGYGKGLTSTSSGGSFNVIWNSYY